MTEESNINRDALKGEELATQAACEGSVATAACEAAGADAAASVKDCEGVDVNMAAEAMPTEGRETSVPRAAAPAEPAPQQAPAAQPQMPVAAQARPQVSQLAASAAVPATNRQTSQGYCPPQSGYSAPAQGSVSWGASTASQQARGFAPQQGYAAPAYTAPTAPAPVYVAVPSAPAAAAEPASKRNWAKPIVWVLLTLLLALAAFGIGSCAGMVTSTVNSSLDPNGSALASLDEDAIAVISLSGEIGYNGSSSSPEGFKMLLDEAEKNDHIKAVLIRVNSGGGSATAGEEMAAYLKDFSKPVVVSSASVNASAAYEISSQADYIYVNKSTEIGSIGTIIQFTDYSDLLDKLGIKSDNIASADSKDSSYGTRELTEEEREYYQNLVDQINQVFIDNVAEGRNMSVDEVRKLATGMVFSGTDAVENGIADEIGTREDASKKAAELGGIKTDDYREVSLTLGSSSSFTSILDLLGSSQSSPAQITDILEDGNHGGNAE